MSTTEQCALDAIVMAKELLPFYVDLGGAIQWSVDEQAKEVGSVPSIDGTQIYTVFEVWGYVSHARYRMRFAYYISHENYILMGEEILEDA